MIDEGFRLFPEQASTVAPQIDALYFFLLAVSGFFTLLIAALIVFFAVRYRRGSTVDRTRSESHQTAIEITWIVVPLILTMIMFGWGASLYFSLVRSRSRCWAGNGCGSSSTPRGGAKSTSCTCRAGAPYACK